MSFIDRIFPNPLPSIDDILNKYKKRNLPEGSKVTRIAPSPTGFMHIGGIYTALICERVAHQSNGVFFLRIEDTDTKREVEGATKLICSSLSNYNILPDEGIDSNGQEFGDYGPYKQSERKSIYQAFIKYMLEQGKAYPCFATTEELDELRKKQELSGARPGYYSHWAKYRNLSETQILEKLDAGIPFVIRFKSEGNYNNKIVIQDGLKGKINFPENDLDVVIMKSDGLPTYHFAHVIDDTLMGTTHVIRGDEWLSSLPLHIQLFKALGFTPPKYTHISPIQKMDGDSRRKLSKRHDPEADVRYYDSVGYPKDAVIEYLLNLANSNFEYWRRNNPSKSYKDFNLELKKLSPSGALFDFVKLNNISKEIIAKMSAEELFINSFEWAKQNDSELYLLMQQNSDYVKSILSIERTGAKNARKDIAKYSDIKEEIKYFFDDRFSISDDKISEIKDIPSSKEIVKDYIEIFNETDTNQEWFNKMLTLSSKYGFAKNAKEYKLNPSNYKGDVSSVVKIFRILLTGKTQSPDLSEIQKTMGSTRVLNRLKQIDNIIKD